MISERPITKSEVILNARVVGGIQMIDNGEADDKIVAILENDNFWGDVRDISELPKTLVERLRHYFGTYKLVPGQASQFSIEKIYDREYAFRVIEAAIEDYDRAYREEGQTETQHVDEDREPQGVGSYGVSLFQIPPSA